MKARVAMYVWLQYPDWDAQPMIERDVARPEHVRITEFVEVDFPDLPPDNLVAEKLTTLQADRTQTVERFTRQLKRIDEQIAELQALPGPQSTGAPSDSQSDGVEAAAL
jgi:hypothetical protein